MKEKSDILLIEDDTDLGRVLMLYLEMEFFSVTLAGTAEEAMDIFIRQEFDIAVIDVNLPGKSGFELAEWIREQNRIVPFVFLTARILKEDRLHGLKLGADDYIIKPFDAEELVLRIRNVLKRSGKSELDSLRIGEFELDTKELKLINHGNVQTLTYREADLLAYLIRNKNKLVKSSSILNDLWGKDDYFLNRSMNVFISRIRKYLQNDPRIRIINIRGVGYEIRID